VFRGLPPRSFEVFATSDTRASPAVALDATKGANDLRLVLADATIDGTVVDEKGAPVAEAEVDARPELGSMLIALGADDVSDSHGRFALGPLPEGSYSLSAEWPGVGSENMFLHDTVTAKPGQHDVKLVLPAAGTITGVVTARGNPLPLFAVAIDNHGFFLTSATMVSASDGRFTRGAVPPGTWTVGLVGDDTELHTIEGVRVEAGKTTDLGTIDLPLGRRVHGRVVDASGAPVASADILAGMMVNPIALQDDDDPLKLALHWTRHVTTGPDGRFEVALAGSVLGRRERIMAMTPNGTRSPEVVIPDGDADVLLQLTPSSAIAGMVHGAGSMVHVMARGDAGMGAAPTDDRGSYRIDGLAPGHYTVTAMRMQPMQSTAPVEVDVAVGATATADLAFPSGGVTLVVLGAHGTPDRCFVLLVHGALEDAQSPAGMASCTDRVELPDIAPDTYKLCVNEACRDITVTAAPLEQTIDLSATRCASTDITDTSAHGHH
jgi:hypothetical protein